MARRNSKPEVAVIGLGRFGSSLALTLAAAGCKVLGIDRDRVIVQRLADDLTQTVALDATDEDALRAIDITAFDTVVVAIGADFESGLMATVALKILGVRRVICKALTERQKSILLKVGADQVVLPEHEAGQRLAHSLTTPLLLDQFALGNKHTLTELRVPPSFVGQTLREVDLRGRFGVTLLAVKRADDLIISPPATHRFAADDLLVAIGANEQIARLSELA
jgi:trk system potassium uptake protein TrkA